MTGRLDGKVAVITGADRGTQSRVIQVDREKGKALVESVNRVYKHVKRSQKHQEQEPRTLIMQADHFRRKHDNDSAL